MFLYKHAHTWLTQHIERIWIEADERECETTAIFTVHPFTLQIDEFETYVFGFQFSAIGASQSNGTFHHWKWVFRYLDSID